MKKEKGFSLIEVMIAIALLGIIGVAFLGALSTASKAIFIADERATAESLARSEMEYVKNQDYSSAPWDYTVTSLQGSSTDQPSWWDDDNPPLLSSNYDGYTVNVTVEPLHDIDDGIQKITVVVYHPYDAEHPEKTKMIVTLEGYRALR